MYEIPADRIDDATENFQQAIEEIRAMTGLAGAYLLVSTDNGRVVTMTLWESRADMEARPSYPNRLTGKETSRRVEMPPRGFSPGLRARVNMTSSC